MEMLLLYYCTIPVPVSAVSPHRYGLPVNFVAVVIKPHRKSHKKVSDTLKDMYGYLDTKFVASEVDVSVSVFVCVCALVCVSECKSLYVWHV